MSAVVSNASPLIVLAKAEMLHNDPHDATGRFDFALANPPFNVNAVNKELLACGGESQVSFEA